MVYNNEETILEQSEHPKTVQETVRPENASQKSWKRVMIGGVAAIAVGTTAWSANSLFGANAAGEQQQEDSPGQSGQAVSASAQENVTQHQQEASGPYDHLSFADAFDAARELVGSGGVFTWRDQLYNTYTETEWEALSEDERDAFIDAVKEEANHEPHAVIVQTNLTSEAEVATDVASELTPETNAAQPISLDVVLEEGALPGGEQVVMGQIAGHHATIIDVDPLTNDGGDIAIIDLNNNFAPDANEVFNAHTGEQQDEATGARVIAAIQEAITSASEPTPASTATPQDMAHYTSDNEIAPDMPDYMNDADVHFA